MAKRIFSSGNLTFAPTASGAQATSGGAMSLSSTLAGQTTDILEVLISGKATSSTVAAMYLSRQSTAGTGGATALSGNNSDGPLNPGTAALGTPVVAAVTYVTNQPIPSSAITDAKLQLGLNLFGGIIRWNAAPTQQMTMIGATVPLAGVTLYNNSSGGSSGLADAHILYESY